jgi:hypothetical protein
MLVSFWHFVRRLDADISFSDMFEAACNGTSVKREQGEPGDGAVPEVRGELRDPAGNARKLAQFVGQPFSPAEEEEAVVVRRGFTTLGWIYTTLSNGCERFREGLNRRTYRVESAVPCVISMGEKSPFQFTVGLRESGAVNAVRCRGKQL